MRLRKGLGVLAAAFAVLQVFAAGVPVSAHDSYWERSYKQQREARKDWRKAQHHRRKAVRDWRRGNTLRANLHQHRYNHYRDNSFEHRYRARLDHRTASRPHRYW